jgi:hypothetical protein
MSASSLSDEYRMQNLKNSQIFDAVSMSCGFITQFVNMINCIIFHVKVMTLVLLALSQQHTNCEWNPCWIVEEYCQLQVYRAKNFDIGSKQKI